MTAIKVIDYDPSWPAAFRAERAGILALIGDLVEDIHHIGSTSVPGLAAKPKIDIDAVLRSAAEVPQAVERIKAAGYAFHGDPYGDGRWIFTHDAYVGYGIRLYVCGPHNPAHEERVLFRDWLRTHPDDAQAYETLKRRLAVEANGDWSFYTGGKSAFISDIVGKAAGVRAAPHLPAGILSP